MKIDFTGVEGMKDFTPIPAGKYLVEVADYRESEAGENANNPGAPIVSWCFSVQDGDYENRTVWDNMAIISLSDEGGKDGKGTKGTLWRVKGLLEACGFEVPDDEIDFDPDEVLGSTLIIRVSVQKPRKNKETGEEYEARNVVKGFLPAPQETPAPA